jgi:hypothetical protein
VGRGSRRRPPARPRPRAAWGTPAKCRSRARLGLKDRVADRTYDATARQAANPPDPTLFVRPGTRSLVEMAICRHFEPIVWPRDWGTKGAAPSDETTQPAYLQALQETGATGLEPATSGVTVGRCELPLLATGRRSSQPRPIGRLRLATARPWWPTLRSKVVPHGRRNVGDGSRWEAGTS